MKIKIPKNQSYNLPEGEYSAFLKEVIPLKKSDKEREQEKLRLVFEITSLIDPRTVYLAGKNYSVADGSKLGFDLDSWLGDELVQMIDDNGELEIEKMQNLKGRSADLDIAHIDNGEYEEPFKFISRIMPAGTLVGAIAA